MEPDEIDVLAPTVFRGLEEIDHAIETRLAREVWRDLPETNRLDRIHLDLTRFHAVAAADRDVGARPDSNAARDLPAPNSVAEPLGEDHQESLHLRERANHVEVSGGAAVPGIKRMSVAMAKTVWLATPSILSLPGRSVGQALNHVASRQSRRD